MKLPRRNFLHLAAGAAALPAVSRIAWTELRWTNHRAGRRGQPRARPIRSLKDSRGFAGAGRRNDYELTKGLDSRRHSRNVKRLR
jgi:hypothetical protein